ncbi:hypothetical protein SCHPADRAFT_833319 [Schizopora paradoxa]|uniref:F-box domain-containing protein n=1 Tax=Schizopora paradoxa TaxID=27342 RepID=A0A0H2RDU0_9AGAM|nr:hypothetical protein SCHPADRAFT_833319 [Schizopora paradoxa]
MLMNVPVDVFYEASICCYLAPLDLLNLGRSSHSLRGLLMTKKSAYVWRAARESMSLPSIPPQLSEPQYANLLFCLGCQVRLYVHHLGAEGTC